MFWRVASFNQSSAVEAVLDRPDYTLEDLLEEDDLIQVCALALRHALILQWGMGSRPDTLSRARTAGYMSVAQFHGFLRARSPRRWLLPVHLPFGRGGRGTGCSGNKPASHSGCSGIGPGAGSVPERVP